MKVNLLDKSLYAGDPYQAYAWLRQNDPVYWDPESELWGLSLHKDVLWAERQPDLFSSASGSRPKTGPNPSMIDRDDPKHARQRRLVYKGFTPKRVAAQEDHVRSIAVTLIEKVQAKGSCDFVHEVAAPLPMILIAEMLGVRTEDRDLLQRWSDEMICGADGVDNVTPAVIEAHGEFTDYTNQVIEERRAEPRDDLISVLVHAEDRGDTLTHEELLGEALLLLVGGNETTRNVISGSVEALSGHPDQREKLLSDDTLMAVAVEECLRWVTPIINMARTATADVEVRGKTIRKGQQLWLMYGSANRDERVFDRPDVFDVERAHNPHVAFGFGSHFCLGASLARLEIRVMLEEVLRRLPDIAVVPGHTVQRNPSSFIRGIPSLPVVYTPR